MKKWLSVLIFILSAVCIITVLQKSTPEDSTAAKKEAIIKQLNNYPDTDGKIFKQVIKNIDSYFNKNQCPDSLTLFLYEVYKPTHDVNYKIEKFLNKKCR